MKKAFFNAMLSLFSLLVISTLFGCAVVKVVPFGPIYPPKNANANIDIYQTKQPDKKYIEIARIEAPAADDNWNMKHLLLKAKELGADGIIITGRVGSYSIMPVYGMSSGVVSGSNNSFTAFGSGFGMSVSEAYGLVAIAIKYTENNKFGPRVPETLPPILTRKE